MILASALCEHHNQQAWWYLVDHNESDPNSLASLLGIDNEKLRSFLKEASLMTKKSGRDGQPSICTPVGAWDVFKTHFDLDVELSKCYIQSIKKKCHRLQVGQFKCKDWEVFAAKNQLQIYQKSQWAPPWTSQILQRAFLGQLDSLGIDDDFSESENKNENGETIQAHPETCWPTVPSVNKKNEPAPKNSHKSDEATGRTIDRPNDKLLQHSKSSFGEPIVSARSTREQAAAAFVKAVLEPIIRGEKEFPTKSVISAVGEFVEAIPAAAINQVSPLAMSLKATTFMTMTTLSTCAISCTETS